MPDELKEIRDLLSQMLEFDEKKRIGFYELIEKVLIFISDIKNINFFFYVF